VQRVYPALREAGGDVVAVTMSKPEVLAGYLKERPSPFPVVSDPQRDQYRRFGLERVRWREYFRPQAVLGYARLIVRGWIPRLPYRGDDVHQQGGDFVVGADGRLIYAFRSATPADRPTPQQLLRVIDG
jgi:peroxiredoxin